MSTIDRRQTCLPSLVSGQRLDRPTFHARYAAMPPKTRAELIGGVVHMPSPLGSDHGLTDWSVSGWLFHYARFTPGTSGANNSSVFLGDWGEPQPDCLLLILPEFGGQSRIEDGFFAGAPELVVEVARSSRGIDLGVKKADYERAGVPEYLVVVRDPDEIFWHVLRDGRYVLLPPEADGLYRSEVFPGLWLDPGALFARDLNGLIATLDQGLAIREHAEFVARLGQMRVPLVDL
ncbi:MAG: Uma2 family endonuclease [Isosphaeraceae bacterium]